MAPHIPSLHREHEYSGVENYDKVFAATWLDYCTFLVGTKDNKLVRWDCESNQRVEIPLPEWSRPASPNQEVCGIHSISINESRTMLATGGANPNDVAIFHLPSFEPVSLLANHEDWLFSAAWITDNRLVTGSRDSTVKLWSVEAGDMLNQHPVTSRHDHSDKVRDLKFDKPSQTITTLSHDATCKIWDSARMEPVKSVPLVYKRELVCLAVEYPLAAIGSQSTISFIDMRCGHVVCNVKSLDEGWGVRSLSFKDNIVTCGGGKGRISFLDLRTRKYIHLRRDENKLMSWESPESNQYYTTGEGYLDKSQPYMQHYDVQSLQHAVYAHQYDETGTKLLVAGGPLPYGLAGCYVAVW